MRRLLILGIPDESLSQAVRQRQEEFSSATGNRLALYYPVHITLRGPFWTDADSKSFRDCLKRICRRHRPLQVLLDGPVFVEPDLCWLQVPPTEPCFPALRDIHDDLEDEVNRLISVDDVPARFKGEGYRPHMTLGWGIDSFNVDSGSFDPPTNTGSSKATTLTDEPHKTRRSSLWRPLNLSGTIERIGIGLYPEGWPAEGTVEVVEAFLLGEVQDSNFESS